MSIDSLLQALTRLAPAMNFHITVIDDHYARPVIRTNAKKTHHRRSTIEAMRANSSFTYVADLDVDLNDMVIGIRYEETAPWWAIKPVADAMEGK